MAIKEVRIPSGSKLGSNFPPIEIMEIGQPGMPGELIIHNGRLWVYGPNGETYIDGGLIQTDAILANSITADKLVIGAQNFSHDLVWSADDEETISWDAGTLKTSNEEEHSIDAGSFNDLFDEQSEGPNSPESNTNDTSIGDVAWLFDWGDVFTADENTVSAEFTPSDTISNYLKITDFGFSIPSNRKILGIKVEAKIFGDYGGGDDYAIDYRVRIIKNNVIRTANKAEFQDIADFQYYTYGSESDLWGEQWTPDDINSSSFGVALAFEGIPNGSTLDSVAHVDHVRITVYYGKIAYIYYDGTPVLKSTNDPTEVVGDDVLLLAIVEKGGVGGKIVINPINASGTTIKGDQIVTGRIQSSDGKTYFDLNEGRLIVNDGSDDVILVGKKSV